MAVTHPQLCTHSLKFRPTDPTYSNRRQFSRFRTHGGMPNCAYASSSQRFRYVIVPKCSRGRLGTVRAKAMDGGAEVDVYGDSVADNYYSVLGVLPDATSQEIKKAYYNCMRACHPDLSGNDVETTNFCMFVNEVYEILSDPVQRTVYDEIHGYSLRTINPFFDDSKPKDHTFVDEFSCIGCKNCANVAPDVFNIEEDFGRARVACQTGNPDSVQQAVDSCPVDCIHWVSAAQLSLLEDEMRRVERVNDAYERSPQEVQENLEMANIVVDDCNTDKEDEDYTSDANEKVGLMLSNMGYMSPDVFAQASSRWEKRQARAVERTKIKMVKEKRVGKVQTYWEGLWGANTQETYHSTENGKAYERASKAAAAARKWREYSRRGVDRRPTCSLPGKSSLEDQKEVQNV